MTFFIFPLRSSLRTPRFLPSTFHISTWNFFLDIPSSTLVFPPNFDPRHSHLSSGYSCSRSPILHRIFLPFFFHNIAHFHPEFSCSPSPLSLRIFQFGIPCFPLIFRPFFFLSNLSFSLIFSPVTLPHHPHVVAHFFTGYSSTLSSRCRSFSHPTGTRILLHISIRLGPVPSPTLLPNLLSFLSTISLSLRIFSSASPHSLWVSSVFLLPFLP